jgi:hypothetical protein
MSADDRDRASHVMLPGLTSGLLIAFVAAFGADFALIDAVLLVVESAVAVAAVVVVDVVAVADSAFSIFFVSGTFAGASASRVGSAALGLVSAGLPKKSAIACAPCMRLTTFARLAVAAPTTRCESMPLVLYITRNEITRIRARELTHRLLTTLAILTRLLALLNDDFVSCASLTRANGWCHWQQRCVKQCVGRVDILERSSGESVRLRAHFWPQLCARDGLCCLNTVHVRGLHRRHARLEFYRGECLIWHNASCRCSPCDFASLTTCTTCLPSNTPST